MEAKNQSGLDNSSDFIHNESSINIPLEGKIIQSNMAKT